MKYVILGAGAIGGVVGGRLFQAGRDVTLIARGDHLAALRANGLRLESQEGAATLDIPAVGHPREVEWTDDDVVLIAVKGQQTQQALTDLAAAIPRETPIVCLQNGIANEAAALRLFPNVYAVPVACPASHLRPGVVQVWSSPVSGMLDIGRFPSGIDEVTETIAADFRAATFQSETREDIMRWKRRKLLMNLGNSIEVVCEPMERGGPLLDLLQAEGAAVLTAAGIEPATAEEDRIRREGVMTFGPIDGQERGGGSSWQSIQRHTGDVETDYLNGEIVLLGRLHGVPTPANELMQTLARRRSLDPDSTPLLPADDVLRMLRR